MTPVTTAVILAAGLGSRLGELGERRPKGLLPVGDQSLVARSCAALVRAGITRILVGTGHEEGAYRAFASGFDGADVECVYNPDYATTGSMATLHALRDHLREPCLVLESDLLYEERALHRVLASPHPDVILASGFTGAGDEVYMELDGAGRLRRLSKHPDDLQTLDAELVGITKLGVQAYADACDLFAARAGTDPRLDYEHCLMHLSQRGAGIPVEVVEDLVWCEVDDTTHLERARTVILPRVEGAITSPAGRSASYDHCSDGLLRLGATLGGNPT